MSDSNSSRQSKDESHLPRIKEILRDLEDEIPVEEVEEEQSKVLIREYFQNKSYIAH